jgi:hypothetical protein
MKKVFWIYVWMLEVSLIINVWQWYHKPEPSVVIERDTVWRDSIIREPIAAETINIGKTVYVRIPVHGERDTLRDTIRDSIDVPIPIMQKRYDDSLYTAWVSGFEPNLDSIRLYTPEITTTITKTIVKPSPLFSVGIQTGAGYGIISRQPDFYIGIGGQLNLWRK